MGKVLIVDDEVEIADLVEVYLSMHNHMAVKVNNPLQVLEMELEGVDVAVLDIMMPDLDGLTLCRALRQKGFTFPIIMLTAKDSEQDIIGGLVYGADDYLVKPFNPLELVARINAQLRRVRQFSLPVSLSSDGEEGIYRFNGLVVDETAHTCHLYEKKVVLTPTEFSILLLLIKNRGKVISSEEIFVKIWKEKYLESNNTVMTHIQNLRKKLGDTDKNKQYIQTIWGVGYKLDDKI